MELQGYPDANNGLRIALPDRGPAVQCDSQGIKFTAIGSGPNTRNEPEKWTSCAVVHRVDRISTMSVQRFQGRDADVFGHHFLVCLQDTSLTAEEREYLAALKPLGILLHPGNLPNTDSPESITASVAELLQQIRSATQREELLIAMTHEATSALPSPLPSWPTCDRYAQAAGDVQVPRRRLGDVHPGQRPEQPGVVLRRLAGERQGEARRAEGQAAAATAGIRVYRDRARTCLKICG